MQKLLLNTYKIRLWGLILLLTIAAILHIFYPSFFYPLFPSNFPSKTVFIVITGPLEIFLAYGLYRSSSRKLYSRLTAMWFTLLTPFHVNMAMNHTEFVGISKEWLPLFLWGRVFLQFIFIFWAYSIRPRKKLKKKTLGQNLRSV